MISYVILKKIATNYARLKKIQFCSQKWNNTVKLSTIYYFHHLYGDNFKSSITNKLNKKTPQNPPQQKIHNKQTTFKAN